MRQHSGSRILTAFPLTTALAIAFVALAVPQRAEAQVAVLQSPPAAPLVGCADDGWRRGCYTDVRAARWSRTILAAENRQTVGLRVVGATALGASAFAFASAMYAGSNTAPARELGGITAVSVLDGLILGLTGLAMWAVDHEGSRRRMSLDAARAALVRRSENASVSMWAPALFVSAVGVAHLVSGILLLAQPGTNDAVRDRAMALGATSQIVTGAFLQSAVVHAAASSWADRVAARELRE